MSGPARPAGAAADLLFLAPCVPAPDGDGARVRWYHMLRYLSQRYRVHFGGIAGQDSTPGQVARIKAMCYETCFVPPPALHERLRERVSGTGAADRELAAWSTSVAQRFSLLAAIAGSARMARHLEALPGDAVRLADYLDLESDELELRAAQRLWPAGRVARHSAGRVRAHERGAARHLDHILFASGRAAARFGQCASASAHLARTLENGVDADYFSPHILHRCPYPPACRTLVFAGAMDDSPNAEAADWFVRQVFWPLREQGESLQLHIVGARPDRRVLALRDGPGVTITGAVPDVRPWLAHAALVVVPLRRAHGMQTMLEALSMQQRVLASPAALETAPFQPGAEVLLAGQPAEWMQAIRAALGSPSLRAVGKAARARVLRDFGWETRLAALDRLLAPAAPRNASGA
jgi:sugar transferase (PEP-CTERM/EpsH1 system associated)